MHQPPRPEQRDHRIEIHGESWNDPYYWLKNKDDPSVIDYLNRENRYATDVMKHTENLQKTLYEEMKKRIKETDQSVPVKIDDYWYYHRTVKDKDYKIYCRKKGSLESDEEILLDINQLADSHDYTYVASIEVSPDHTKLAYSVDHSGYETFEIFVKDLTTNELLPYRIENTGGIVIWADDQSLYYNSLDDIHRSYQLWYHQLGRKDLDLMIYKEENNQFYIYAWKSTDKQYVFIASHGRESDVIRYINLSQSPIEVVKFNDQQDHVEYDIDHHDGYFYFLTSKDALNFRLCRALVTDTGDWQELISHNKSIKLDQIKLFKGFGVIKYRFNGYQDFRVFSMSDFTDHTIELPERIHSVYFEENPNFVTDVFRFQYSSLVTPRRVYAYTIPDHTLEVLKEDEINNYQPYQFQTKRELAVARDGNTIPISIAYKQGISFPAPLLLYGYGSYGLSFDPNFDSKKVSLLERGIIIAIAHVRGGGELGKQHYHEGKLLNKKNTFNDFVDAAEFLIRNNYTNSSKLAITGGSAGGLLMGAVVNLRPDLFKAVVALVPFVDVVSTMMDDSIPLTTFEYLEWGDPADEKYFEYIRSYSPYDQLGSVSTDYPEILVKAGLNDPRVHFWEPAKWVARLRQIKTDDNRLILKTNMGAGHGGASGRYQRMKEIAFNFAFIIDALEIEPQ